MKFSISMSAAVLAAVASNTLWIPGAHASPDSGKTVSLAALVNRSLQANPDVLAAQSAVDAAKARLGGTALPLHNPALEAEVESAGANTYQLGISQTIDWHDKRSAFEQLAQTEYQAVRQQLAALKLAKSTELLDAIGRIASQTGIKDLSQRRTQIMTRFANLAKQRHAAGDIPQAELELARLSLAESKMQLAGNQAELIQAHGDFFSLSGQMLTEKISLPANLKLHLVAAEDIESIARQHPEVQAALLQAQKARQNIRATDLDRKADPTLGISAGRDDKDNLIAFRFSLPLQVRNSFQSQVEVARAEALQLEQLAQQAFWNVRARLNSAEQRYKLVSSAWAQWTEKGRSSLNSRIALLETLWKSGEISTTDYLLQIQQTLDTQIAGIELHGDLWNAWLAWMSASAQLDTWLNKALRKPRT